MNRIGIPDLIMKLQPHMQYVDLSNNGYMLLDVTPERVENKWVSVFTTAYSNESTNIENVLEVKAGDNHIYRG